ncbi:hypothetical protein ABFS82_02G026100 [Erythranthe guttata]
MQNRANLFSFFFLFSNLKMWSIEIYIVGFVIVLVTQLITIYRWRNPKCNGKLPPGSLGFPFIGECLELIFPAHSYDVHPFIKKRLQRYGPVFRTNIAGRNVVVSADHEFNSYILQQEEKLVVRSYLDLFEKLFKQSGKLRPDGLALHKYMKTSALSRFGLECIKKSLLLQFDQLVRTTLHSWSTQDRVDLKHASVAMFGEFGMNQLCICDPETSKQLVDNYINGTNAIMSFPLNIPGTTYYKSLQAEHEEIIAKRKNPDSSVTWEEYKSMTFTLQVVNEALRLGNTVPGFLRKAVKDIKVKGYTIPAGWAIMACHSVLHLDPNIYKDPLKFDPSRWKNATPEFISKNLKPFGGGIKQCAGADFSRASMCIFLHVFVTKYRWTIVEGGDIIQNPIMHIKNGLHISLSEKRD